MRIVLDTNIFISALISPGGHPDRLVDAWLRGDVTVVTSREQLAEIAGVLARDRMRKWIDQADADALLAHIETRAEIIDGLPRVSHASDPDDNVIIATAIAGAAVLLVTGDKSHLLSLGEVEGIRILSPTNAVAMVEGREA